MLIHAVEEAVIATVTLLLREKWEEISPQGWRDNGTDDIQVLGANDIYVGYM